MKIKITNPTTFTVGLETGQVFDVPEAWAEHLMRAGQAETVEAPAPPAVETPKPPAGPPARKSVRKAA